MSFRLAAEMLIMGGAARTLDEALALVQTSIQKGTALATLHRFVALNGGDTKALDDFSRLPQAGQVVDIRAERAGHIAAIDGRALGLLAMDLGAGRRDRNDLLDLGVGLRVLAQVGRSVVIGEPLFRVHAKADARIDPAPYLATLHIGAEPVAPAPWLLETLGC
jgi:pyrimidine-nucleoside phosphorylase